MSAVMLREVETTAVSTKVRNATLDDIPNMLRMGRSFLAVSGAQHIPFDEESCVQLFEKLIESDDAILLVAGSVGMAAALVYPAYFNLNYVTGQELFWWLDPEYRRGRIGLEMFRKLERWASERAQGFTMIALAESESERIGRFYVSSGYKQLETHFTKVF